MNVHTPEHAESLSVEQFSCRSNTSEVRLSWEEMRIRDNEVNCSRSNEYIAL